MRTFDFGISDSSLWITATPTQLTLTMPFYIIEAGHFYADSSYMINRDALNSYLFFYSVKGCGLIKTEDTEFVLPSGHAAIIDCRRPHCYSVFNGSWEFIWFHFMGTAADSFFSMLYQKNVCGIQISDIDLFTHRLLELIKRSEKNDTLSCTENSGSIHLIFSDLMREHFEAESKSRQREHNGDIYAAIDYIKKHYSESVTIDDMISAVHISKYHFIRLFNRIMGITPYSYLMNYRINISKTLLHSTDKPVLEIALKCGFTDAGNFAKQFKAHTGQKPLEYRRYFTISSWF